MPALTTMRAYENEPERAAADGRGNVQAAQISPKGMLPHAPHLGMCYFSVNRPDRILPGGINDSCDEGLRFARLPFYDPDTTPGPFGDDGWRADE